MPNALARRCSLLVFAALAGAHLDASAQTAPSDTVRVLPEVVVTALGPGLAEASAPLALAARTLDDAEAVTATGDLSETLAGLPGLWLSDRGSYAQGPRLLVRGLGWRSAFGVRGTHVMLDGIPLTLADGQTQLGVIAPDLVTGVAALRGPASVRWGSGSGGALALSTDAPPDAPSARLRASGGGFGRAAGSVTLRHRAANGRRLAAWASGLREDGYRDHSGVRLARFGATGALRLGQNAELGTVALLLHMPRAESPGGIRFEDAEADPRQTRAIVLARDASKAVTQAYAGLRLRSWRESLRFDAALYGGLRALDNPIVPRYIEIDRRTLGTRLTVSNEADRYGWAVGTEAELQRDDRLERSNDGGEPGDVVLTDQVESVRSGALFAQVQRHFGERAAATLAARGDLLHYRAEPAGEAASSRTLGAISPSFGVSMSLGPRNAPFAFAYANLAGALDAPTTTELGNRTDGTSGFDGSLEPERTWSGEVGARGYVQPDLGALGFAVTVGFDVAFFAATVRDLLVPFEIDDVTFYRNEGRTQHLGLEIALSPTLGLGLDSRIRSDVAYMWTRARFADSAGSLTVEGNAVPGVPEHLVTGSLTWTAPRALVATVSGEAASGYPADSQNTASTEAYAVLHLRLGAQLGRGAFRARPFAALRNAFDVRYTGSVVVNGFGGRYAEPAAGRHLIVGVTVDVR